METPFDSQSPTDCFCGWGEDCACGPGEKVIRQISGGFGPAMTREQREWCLDEIGSVEGYSRADHEEDDDAVLATNVLTAWTDYCRDKGLI